MVADHGEQGWALLCNGLVLFDDGGFIAPAVPAPRLPVQHHVPLLV